MNYVHLMVRLIWSTFFTLFKTTLPHILINQKLSYLLIKCSFDKSVCKYICCEKRRYARHINWRDDEMIKALTFHLENIYVRFDIKVYRLIVCIPIGTNCTPVISVLFFYCYESQFMIKLSKTKSR